MTIHQVLSKMNLVNIRALGDTVHNWTNPTLLAI